MAEEISYVFETCTGSGFWCDVIGMNVEYLHEGYYYKSVEFGCVKFAGKKEVSSMSTVTIIDGVYVDCDACSAGKHLQAHHFRKGCSEAEYEDIWVMTHGKIKPEQGQYYQDYYNGCWQYIGKDDIGITGQFLDYMDFQQTPYDDCHCSQMFDAYLFKDCDGNELYFKVGPKLVIGKHYFEKNIGVCCEFIGKTQITFEPTTKFKDGGECNCYKYMMFETCDGKHKFYTPLDYMSSIPDLQYGDDISLTDDPCGHMRAWIYAYLEGGSDACYSERIAKLQELNIDFELYINCFKFLKLVQEKPSDIEEYPWKVYGVDQKCESKCCEVFFLCECKLCGSDEPIKLFLSNTIINTINNSSYNVFVTKNCKYTIDKIVYNESTICEKQEEHEEDFIYATDVIEYLESCDEEEENCELTIKPKHGDVEYYERVNCEFASAVFNEAMAERYGVEFCCKKDLQRLTIKKKLLDAGALQDDVDLCKCEI